METFMCYISKSIHLDEPMALTIGSTQDIRYRSYLKQMRPLHTSRYASKQVMLTEEKKALKWAKDNYPYALVRYGAWEFAPKSPTRTDDWFCVPEDEQGAFRVRIMQILQKHSL
jgi:hypothetical protein